MARKKKEEEKIEEEAPEEENIEEVDGPAETGDEELDETEEGSKFAFPNAGVVRIIRSEIDRDKMIRRKVKESMNLWLEKLCRKVSRKMNQSEYTVLEIDDFKTAIEPYELVEEVEEERKRIVATLEKIKMDCDSLIRDVNRKFISEGTTLFGDQRIEEVSQEPEQTEEG
ncbi:MAG: hypothetical protein ABH834_08055 [Candidatus Altiarchaeota archaeon]